MLDCEVFHQKIYTEDIKTHKKKAIKYMNLQFTTKMN